MWTNDDSYLLSEYNQSRRFRGGNVIVKRNLSRRQQGIYDPTAGCCLAWSLSERLHKTNFLVTALEEMLCYTAWGNSVTWGIVESDLYIKVYVTALPWQIPKEE